MYFKSFIISKLIISIMRGNIEKLYINYRYIYNIVRLRIYFY